MELGVKGGGWECGGVGGWRGRVCVVNGGEVGDGVSGLDWSSCCGCALFEFVRWALIGGRR